MDAIFGKILEHEAQRCNFRRVFFVRLLRLFNLGTGKLRVTVGPVRLDAFGSKDIFYVHNP